VVSRRFPAPGLRFQSAQQVVRVKPRFFRLCWLDVKSASAPTARVGVQTVKVRDNDGSVGTSGR